MTKKTKKITLGVMSSSLAIAAPIATVVSCGKETSENETSKGRQGIDSSNTNGKNGNGSIPNIDNGKTEAVPKVFEEGEINIAKITERMKQSLKQNKTNKVSWETNLKDPKDVKNEYESILKETFELILNQPKKSELKDPKKQQEFLKKAKTLENKITKHTKSQFGLGGLNASQWKPLLASQSKEELKQNFKNLIELMINNLSYKEMSLYDPKTNKEIYKETYSEELRKVFFDSNSEMLKELYKIINNYGILLIGLIHKPVETMSKYGYDKILEMNKVTDESAMITKKSITKIKGLMFPTTK
ncbi:Vmc-like lipoprotein signal peptide domain-containing protein [Mycoplasma todarodis]|uniref:Variable surface lipoprotein n=1 Tax=Mycoplasma todarodis TaxID=1937191 RepID=A0A4R0XVZ3_9MOLU|nr:hypothetical protein [Mycoplasma todarodis]TCG11976.1 hypothetical protein C4B25_00530 [Mycoplasma todarodis]